MFSLICPNTSGAASDALLSLFTGVECEVVWPTLSGNTTPGSTIGMVELEEDSCTDTSKAWDAAAPILDAISEMRSPRTTLDKGRLGNG